MTEIKLTKRYPQSRTEDIVDAYMRGWNDALDAVQNGKFIINDDRKTENSSEKPNNRKDEPQTNADQHVQHIGSVETMSCQECKHWIYDDRWGWFCPLKSQDECQYQPKDEPTISKMEQVDKGINVRSKEPQTCETCKHHVGMCLISECNYEAEPQTESLEQFRVGLEYHTDTTHFGKVKGESITSNTIEDEPQTDCAWR